MKVRYAMEGFHGWFKAQRRLRQTMLRGVEKVSWEFNLYCMDHRLRMMALAR